MFAYILKRLLLIIPTLFGIMLVNFIIVQAAPGGPVEQAISQITGTGVGATERFAGGGGDMLAAPKPQQHSTSNAPSKYRGAQGLEPDVIKSIEKMYGFDKPAHERFWIMMKDYATFHFGDSFFKGRSVVSLVLEKMPVSISLGLWTTLLIYIISIPLGIKKAVRDGTPFDVWTSTAITIGYAIPSFLFAVLLIILFAGGSYVSIFPLRGLTSDGWSEMSLFMKVADYFWHLVLPIVAMVIGGFASLTMLTKNSFIEEIGKQYVLTARAKGCSERQVLYGHVFRNAMLIVIAGFPAAFLSILFTGSLLIEVIFSLDGLGLLGFEAAMNRDYPVMFGTLFFFTLLGLIFNLIGDILYTIVDPRIDFAKLGKA
ncbi:MAG: microcin C ABC transporter permease YejB [Proteobacteria bacterium]|nr:microcin C ABC transporter permease YejB [Pseudomonadota bacterium]